MRGVTRFSIKGKLAPRYVRSFEIVEKISDVAYCLNLLPQLSYAHDVFLVSMLQKYTLDRSHFLPYAEIPLQPDVTYEVQSTEILAREVRMFHNKETSMVKALWERHNEEGATYELESGMYKKYP